VPWTLTLRVGPQVRRERFAVLPEALDALEQRLGALGGQTRRGTARAGLREVEPVRQVAARGEVSGPQRLLPRTILGVDLRGDGSAEAYVGRVRKRLVAPEGGETPFDALRRVAPGSRAGAVRASASARGRDRGR
jgi:hypothetical protein